MNPANALILMGASMIVISIYKLWRPSEGCLEHILILPGGFEYRGCSMWGVVLLLGSFLFWTGATSNNSSTDNPNIQSEAKEVSNSFSIISSAIAQTSPKICKPGDLGWVYMGDSNFNKRWWFTIKQGSITHTKGVVTKPLVLTAKALRNIREKHFKDLTGTLLGDLLGYKKPTLVCQIQKGTNFSVTEFVQVGRNRVWAKGSVL